MPPLNHAVLSASSAYRWLECPPSALATADIPDETTIYAQEGSAAHEMAEYKIRWHLGEKTLHLRMSETSMQKKSTDIQTAMRIMRQIKLKQ